MRDFGIVPVGEYFTEDEGICDTCEGDADVEFADTDTGCGYCWSCMDGMVIYDELESGEMETTFHLAGYAHP